jgi:hypothetical protein
MVDVRQRFLADASVANTLKLSKVTHEETSPLYVNLGFGRPLSTQSGRYLVDAMAPQRSGAWLPYRNPIACVCAARTALSVRP